MVRESLWIESSHVDSNGPNVQLQGLSRIMGPALTFKQGPKPLRVYHIMRRDLFLFLLANALN